jgi:hypothetical protein
MMRFKQVFGPEIPMSEARIFRFARSRAFYFYKILFLLIAALWHPYDALRAAPLHVQVIFWSFGFATFLLVFHVCHLGLLRLSLRLGITTVSETLVMLLALVLPYPFQLLLLGKMGVDTGSLVDQLEFLVFNFVLFELGAFGYLKFGDRVLFPEVYDAPGEDPDPARPREIFLRGTSLPISQIEMISASEEGFEAVGMGQTWFVARPFGVAVSELPVDLGFQIHRSIWISRDLAVRHERDERRLFVTLSDGRRLPVARSRQREFQNWVRLIEDIR